MRQLGMGIALVAGLIGLAEPSAAKVMKFEVIRIESPAFEGRVFGSVGTYDRIIARATVAVSPADPHNTSSSTSTAPRALHRAWSRRQPMSRSSVRPARQTATGACSTMSSIAARNGRLPISTTARPETILARRRPPATAS
jgi:hypothetical protein